MEDLDCAAVAENVSISIEFGDLRASDYSLAEGAMTMSSAERGQELMPLWIKKDNSVDMNELLQALLNSFQDFLKSNVEAFPEEVDLIKTQVEWSSCETCSEMKL